DDEIETRVQQNWLSILAGESEDDFLQRLKPLGFNKQMTLASLRQTAITQVLLEKYVVTTRIVTDEKLNREFASTYGFNGVKTEVAHILIMPHYIRAEAMRNNQELSYEQACHQARELAQQCLASLNSGEDFAELVVKYSNDNASNLDRGILPTYRPGMYGDGFSQMVDSLDENAVPPNIVESGAGFHIVQVNSRVKTNFEDVKHDLSLKILQAPADITEIKNAIVDLREAATIEYPQNQSEE
ncbi:MAG: peptidylprolyl isomerase, partial [Planctomycetota bacterium]|nr:peptidylprolyl isomerase [Planctomycetota bacterium]